MSRGHPDEIRQFALGYLASGRRFPRHACNAIKREFGVSVAEGTIRQWRDAAGIAKPQSEDGKRVFIECEDDRDPADIERNNRFKRVMRMIKPLREIPPGAKLDRTTPGR